MASEALNMGRKLLQRARKDGDKNILREMDSGDLWEAGFRPAYQDSSDDNLDEGMTCVFCGMAYYNCVCCHDN